MVRWVRSLIAVIAASLLATQFSCTTTLGTALRDAAIDGAAGFVEGATADLLDRWFGADLAE
jgi:hypothetical protein